MLPMLGGTASWPGEADYMHIARRAGVPLVNGYGRRTSGTYQLIQQTLAHGDAETLAWVLRHFDVTHVMVLPAYETAGTHRDYEPLLCPGAFERVASAADGALYRVIGGACAAHARADRGPLRR